MPRRKMVIQSVFELENNWLTPSTVDNDSGAPDTNSIVVIDSMQQGAVRTSTMWLLDL